MATARWETQEYFKTRLAASEYLFRRLGGKGRIEPNSPRDGLYCEGFRWVVEVER